MAAITTFIESSTADLPSDRKAGTAVRRQEAFARFVSSGTSDTVDITQVVPDALIIEGVRSVLIDGAMPGTSGPHIGVSGTTLTTIVNSGEYRVELVVSLK